MGKALYISYFGLREPLVQSQVLPYMREIAKGGTEMSLLTFEPGLDRSRSRGDLQREEANLAAQGIAWSALKYHKRFSVAATLYDVFRGAVEIRRSVRSHSLDILHARSHVAALMAIVAKKTCGRSVKVLFDIRGFLPEEYVDAGLWTRDGIVYRLVKTAEKWIFKHADGFVVLTERAREILFPESRNGGRDSQGRPVRVIPCCVDFERFPSAGDANRASARAALGATDRLVVAYVGSFGGWYLTDETMRLFALLRQAVPNAFALIITKSEREPIVKALKQAGYSDGDFSVGPLPAEDVFGRLVAADFSISFIKNCYSKQASSPTKNAEYLAVGSPIIVNDGIGDTSLHIKEDRTGIVIADLSDESLRQAIDQMLELLRGDGDLRGRCRRSANARFSLHEVAGERYRAIYSELVGEDFPK